MTKAQLLALLQKHGACEEATKWVESSKKRTAKAIWDDCKNPSWMLWIASLGVDRKLLVLAACACARTALKHVPKGEERPRLAIETAERWTRGEATIEEVREARRAAAAAAADAATTADTTADTTTIADVAAYAVYAVHADVDYERSIARMAKLVRETIPFAVLMRGVR
jgi:hypothetical protein